MKVLQIGYAEADITPEAGLAMGGFVKSHNPLVARIGQGIREGEQLKTRVFCLEHEGQRIFISSSDLCFWRSDQVADIRRQVMEKLPGLASESLLITATHTHSSADNSLLFSDDGSTGQWTCQLIKKTVACILQAAEDLVACEASWVQGLHPYNHNRRVLHEGKPTALAMESDHQVTTGPTDPTLTVLRFDRVDDKRFFWVNWTAHTLGAGPGVNLFTADYPGVLIHDLEQHFPNCKALFTNGAAGNIHPHWCGRPDFQAVDRVGHILSERVIQLEGRMKALDMDQMSVVCDVYECVNRVKASLKARVEVICLTLGAFKIGFLPGEPFVQIQQRFRQAMKPHPSFICGYSNGWTGYMPMQEDYRHGGYGVDLFATDPPEHSRTMLAPGSAEAVLKKLIDLGQTT